MPYKDPEVDKARRKQKYLMIKDTGVCVQCKQPWSGVQKKCDSCRKRDAENKARRIQLREAAGLCNRCGKYPAISTAKYCEECAKKVRGHKDSEETKKKRLQKYHSHYKSILQQRRIIFKENGLCADCGSTGVEFGVVCSSCYAKRRKWYEKSKFRSLSRCDGDCLNCRLPWCTDVDDKVVIKLTAEEKAMSRQLDKDATADERRWSKQRTKDIRNTRNQYNYAISIIAQIDYKEDCGFILSEADIRKRKNAEERAEETRKILEAEGEKVW